MNSHHLLVINPNTTASMTEKMRLAAGRVASSSTKVTAINPTKGPAAIQGPEDGAAALPGLFHLFDEAMSTDPTITAVIIGCFDDTGLFELKENSPIPVIGIGEAAYYVAAVASVSFSVVTTLSISVPVLEANLQRLGLAQRCSRVRASDVPVLSLEDPESDARSRIECEIAAALNEDNVGAIALGCAGMADLARDLTKKYKVPIIDGVASAVKLAEIPMGQ